VAIDSATFEHRARLARVVLGPPAGSPRLIVASRRDFDAALLAAATGAGARLLSARVTDVIREGDTWVVVTRDGAVRAEWLLDADGTNSLVRRRVFRPFARADLSIGTGFFVHGQTSREIAIAFEDDPPGYLWSFPRPDHLAVGACGQADESSAALLLARTSRWIERLVSGPAELERYSWPIPSLRVGTLKSEQPAGARWMLLGDAGGMVDPITREGIYFALTSADAAADSLLAGNDPAAVYTQHIRRTIYAELDRAARLKARFFNPRFTGLLVQALQHSAAIRGVTSDLIAGRQAYKGLRRRLLGTFEVRLMVDMLVGGTGG
jgi:flavin-dependent dehydrogenase